MDGLLQLLSEGTGRELSVLIMDHPVAKLTDRWPRTKCFTSLYSFWWPNNHIRYLRHYALVHDVFIMSLVLNLVFSNVA